MVLALQIAYLYERPSISETNEIQQLYGQVHVGRVSTGSIGSIFTFVGFSRVVS